jgi:hypothetical protein
LSELTELKNKRIFGSVFEVHVNQSLRCEIDRKEDPDGIYFNLYSAIFYGAARLGTSIVQAIPSISENWGEPDLERADMIFKACCLPMISVMSRRIAGEKGWTADQKHEVARRRFEDIANILQMGIDIDYCMNLDSQYDFDADNKNENPASLPGYSYLFYKKIRELLGMAPYLDWESLIYPLRDADNFSLSGAEYTEVITMAGLIDGAAGLMFSAFEKYMAG